MNNDILRRVKIVRLDTRLLVDVLNWSRSPRHGLALPITDEIPEHVDVLAVRADWETDSIEAKVCHSSFDLVAEGCVIPRVPETVTALRVVPWGNPDGVTSCR